MDQNRDEIEEILLDESGRLVASLGKVIDETARSINNLERYINETHELVYNLPSDTYSRQLALIRDAGRNAGLIEAWVVITGELWPGRTRPELSEDFNGHDIWGLLLCRHERERLELESAQYLELAAQAGEMGYSEQAAGMKRIAEIMQARLKHLTQVADQNWADWEEGATR